MAASGALGLVACSGGDDNTGTDGGKDGSKADTGTGMDGNPGMDGTPGDGGPNCDSSLQFHPSPEAGPYCPFQGGDASFSSCALGQTCCEPLTADGGPSTCINANMNCANGVTSWGCDEKADCTQGNMTTCCVQANGALKRDGFCPNVGFLTQVTGSVCKTSCTGVMEAGTSEAPLCSGQSDCPNGTTCIKFSKQAKELGVCLP